MTDEVKGGGMKYRIYFGGWCIDVDRGGGWVYYPHSPPNNIVINITGWWILYIIRYESPPHRSIIPIYIRYGFLFLGLGV